jgi:hypothetical protein
MSRSGSVASRPSSTPGSARGDAREPTVARVIEFTPRERGLGSPANDNLRPTRRRAAHLLGPAVLLAVLAGGCLYLALG